VILLLVANEKRTGQTESPFEKKAEMWWKLKLNYRGKVLWKETHQRVIAPYPKIICSAPME